MAKKTWIIWALFLLLPGFVGLGIQYARKSAIQGRIDLAAQQVVDSSAQQEYLHMYEQWSELPAGEKADNPWGYGAYGGSEIQKRLEQGQSDRLTADILTLEKGFLNYPDELANVMYGPGWRQEVDRFKKERSVIEIVLVGSIFLLTGGGLILAGGLTKLLAVYVIKKRSQKTESSEPEAETAEEVPAVDEASEQSRLIDELPSENDNDNDQDQDEDPGTEEDSTQEDNGYFQSFLKSTQTNPSEQNDFKATELPMKPTKSLFNASNETQKDSYFGWALEQDDTTELETLMTNEPLTKELTELTEEVSAIRHFAAQQQDQMRKLQDGYDWMIIRRFCLRIIRCVDNIDDRVVRLQANGEDAAAYLEDIRDELIFALEAGGIEQFGPDLQTPFKGLEKYAEAVRERVYTEDTGLVGCIAEVTRPGYQYLVNDDDVKIVRCAQVKLYESKQPQ